MFWYTYWRALLCLHLFSIVHTLLSLSPTHLFKDSNLFYIFFFISPLFNQVGYLRTSSHLQLRPVQDKAKQFDTYNNRELHME